MPKFDKSTGYKMKGSSFYGLGNQSPLKGVDQAVIDSQRELGEQENKWKSPRWAGLAKDILAPPHDKKEEKVVEEEPMDVSWDGKRKPVMTKEESKKNFKLFHGEGSDDLDADV